MSAERIRSALIEESMMDDTPQQVTWYENRVDDFDDWLSERPTAHFRLQKRRERKSHRRSRGTEQIFRHGADHRGTESCDAADALYDAVGEWLGE